MWYPTVLEFGEEYVMIHSVERLGKVDKQGADWATLIQGTAPGVEDRLMRELWNVLLSHRIDLGCATEERNICRAGSSSSGSDGGGGSGSGSSNGSSSMWWWWWWWW